MISFVCVHAYVRDKLGLADDGCSTQATLTLAVSHRTLVIVSRVRNIIATIYHLYLLP